MEKRTTRITLIAFGLCLFVAASPLFGDTADRGELFIGLAPGFVTGTLADEITKTLTPSPDGIQEVSLLANGIWYFLPQLGAEFLVRLGSIQAIGDGTKPLNVIDDQSALLGLIARAKIYSSDWGTSMYLDAGGGISMHNMQWDTEYSELAPSTLATISPNVGYYGKVGFKLRIQTVVMGFSIVYETVSANLSNGNDYNFNCLTVPLELGLSF